MRILVTGSAGFLASQLIPDLQSLGHYVIGIDIQHESLSDQPICHDLCTPLNELLSFDLCIHCASSVGGIVFNSLTMNLPEIETCIVKNVISICATARAQRIIYLSSINVFEISQTFKHEKLSDVAPRTPYAKGKAMGEKLIEDHFSNFTIIRPTNFFGALQPQFGSVAGTSHVIPELLHKIKTTSELEILGDGSQVRNFIHVSDVSKFVQACIVTKAQGWFNIRSSIHISIAELT